MHKTRAELEAALEHILASPADGGAVELLQIRPARGEREVLSSVRVTAAGGAEGDRWLASARKDENTGELWPDTQLTLMNSRMIEAIAGEKKNWPPAGDQLFVDLDLSTENLPAGQRLAIGSAIIQITAEPHLGCDQFIARYGIDACRYINSRRGRELRLRGVNAKIVQDGEISTGNVATKV